MGPRGVETAMVNVAYGGRGGGLSRPWLMWPVGEVGEIVPFHSRWLNELSREERE